VDALEAAKSESDRQGLTQSIAHLQLVHPNEQKRIGALGIYNAFTFAWIVPETNYNLMVIPFIEQVKSVETIFDPATYYMQNVYPVKTIRDAGGIITWGSDAPVESRDPRPFLNLEQAITRAYENRVLTADNAIDIHAALSAFTINGARMLGIGDQTGSIEPGKLADLIVLDQNLVRLVEQGAADKISDTQVLTTVFDGKVVYEKTGA
jgi:predicted amidohydrolase YtcJ